MKVNKSWDYDFSCIVVYLQPAKLLRDCAKHTTALAIFYNQERVVVQFKPAVGRTIAYIAFYNKTLHINYLHIEL